eukprot:TRINITY_DN31135_c0_g1_i1.p1 TRINITY_DN31135_c0_g1~~TRINITY_DN31135_c0_g1_i1.p1  ORF type:complete len:462 (+),score=107.85 TRINITY_DN31135_c0_g1_i1:75-1460(+)
MAQDKLVGLFLQSALAKPGDDPATMNPELPVDGKFTDAAIEQGVEACKKMLASEDGIRMGIQPAATFVVLGMALEEKSQLQWAAARCYEEALNMIKPSKNGGGSWERAVVLQQLGAVCHRYERYTHAKKWLAECAEECKILTGHPKDTVIFQGQLNITQTRLEFTSSIEAWRAQTFYKMGDMPQAQIHMAEAQRLQKLISGGDAVERVSADDTSSIVPTKTIKELWAADAGDETRLKRYRHNDEGPTVLLTLELNDHLEIGEQASFLVESLQQFRVNCTDDSVDIRARVWLNGRAKEFRLYLHPLSREIIPEDTVPRLRGKEGKRRLEVKLFKREKQHEWFGDLVRSGPKMPPLPDPENLKAGPAAPKKAPAKPAAKGTALNPLTPEELAALPKPSGDGADNRPSAWRNNHQPQACDAGPKKIAPVEPALRPPAPATEPAPEPAPAMPVGGSSGAALEEMD